MIYTDKNLLAAGWVGGTLSRQWGNMREPAAQTPVYEKLGIIPERILHLQQVHGDTIVFVPDASSAAARQTGPLPQADA